MMQAPYRPTVQLFTLVGGIFLPPVLGFRKRHNE